MLLGGAEASHATVNEKTRLGGVIYSPGFGRMSFNGASNCQSLITKEKYYYYYKVG